MTNAGEQMENELRQALHGISSARFLATRDGDGRPDFVPALSAELTDDDLIRLAMVLPQQTEANLATHPDCALLVVDQDLAWWSLQTRLAGFADGEPGEKVERWALLEVEGVQSSGRHGRLRLAWEYGWIRSLGMPKHDDYAETLPAEIARRFAPLKAVKGVAWVGEDDRLMTLPCLTMVPGGPGALVCGTKATPALREIPTDAEVAVCLLTFAPSAYQIIGRFEGTGGGLLPSQITVRVLRRRPALP